jgi:hypothetical protein
MASPTSRWHDGAMNSGSMTDVSRHRRPGTVMAAAMVAAATLLGLSGCPGMVADGFVDGGFDGFAFAEVSTARRLVIHLDDANPQQRFRFDVTVDPVSPDARITAQFSRVEGLGVAEVAPETFANEQPFAWALLNPGTVLTSFSDAIGPVETMRLSVGTDRPPTILEVTLAVTAPSDVDFDGIEDDVTVDIADPEPFIP